MRVYHFLNSKFGMHDLEHRRLKIARINKLNDPFEMWPRCTSPEERRVIRNWRNEADRRFGLLCFSRNWENPVQWSHYADGHHGLCLGFDVVDSTLERVRYRLHRPRADMQRIAQSHPTSEAHVRAWFRTKYVHWIYEQEERAFVSLDEPGDGGLYYAGFGPGLRLAEVIIGERCKVQRAEITAVLGTDLAAFVELTNARLAFQTYRVVKQHKETL